MNSEDNRHISLEQYQLLEKENIELKIELEKLRHDLEYLRNYIFGKKSERFISEDKQQLSLELEHNEVEAEIKPEPPKEVIISYSRKKKKSNKKRIRQTIPAHLPRKIIVIEPENIPPGAKKIGESITEVLEYTPSKYYVARYVRNKYFIPEEEKIITPELPTLPIPKAIAGAGMLSYMEVCKYVDHLPFYRIIQIFKRDANIVIPASTLNSWHIKVCKLLFPLYNVLKNNVLQSDYLQVDETPLKVLDKAKKGKTHRGYIWVYYSPLNKSVYFDYRSSRSKEGPEDNLKAYIGALQTDGYAAYNGFENNINITLLACMAHVRRKFADALQNNKELSGFALTEIQKLYEIERYARENNLSFEEIKILREEKSVPILNEFEKWLKENLIKVLPQSLIGMAIAYTLNLWNRLIRYVDDGRYQIDNNLIENSIRPVALGRKNYLFAGSHNGAQHAAMIYSFFGTCKINNVNPYEWLRHVLTVIPDWKANKLHELLPQNFKQ